MEWTMRSFPSTPECDRAIEREQQRLLGEVGGAVEVSRAAAIRSAILRGAPPEKRRIAKPKMREDAD